MNLAHYLINVSVTLTFCKHENAIYTLMSINIILLFFILIVHWQAPGPSASHHLPVTSDGFIPKMSAHNEEVMVSNLLGKHAPPVCPIISFL